MKVGARMQVSHFSDLSFDHFIQYSQMVNGKKKILYFFKCYNDYMDYQINSGSKNNYITFSKAQSFSALNELLMLDIKL